ncbi:MAG: DUF1320 family protein [Chloroflexota bacterium]|nr:DUF1320 family protein [Chloroflexota bacterium]
MAYASASDILGRVDARELAERAAPNDREVTGETLSAWIRAGGDPAGLPDGHGYSAALASALGVALGRIEAALDGAGAVIDRHIATRYPDLSDPPEELTAAAVDLFLYRFFGDIGDGAYDRMHADAVRWLERVADGRVDLAPDDGSEPDGAEAAVSAADEVFGGDSLDGYMAGI